MTPAQERKVFKDIKDLLDFNAEMDAGQEAAIAGLSKRLDAIEAQLKTPAPKVETKVKAPVKTKE